MTGGLRSEKACFHLNLGTNAVIEKGDIGNVWFYGTLISYYDGTEYVPGIRYRLLFMTLVIA